MSNKIKKLPLEELIMVMVDAELEIYSLTHKDVKNIDNWYTKFTFDWKEEYESWKEFCIYILRNCCTKKLNKKEANRIFMWIDLMYGLKCNY